MIDTNLAMREPAVSMFAPTPQAHDGLLTVTSESNIADLQEQELLDLFLALHATHNRLIKQPLDRQWTERAIGLLSIMVNQLILDSERWLGADNVQMILFDEAGLFRDRNPVISPIPMENNRLKRHAVVEAYQHWVLQYADQAAAFSLMNQNLLAIMGRLFEEMLNEVPSTYTASRWRSLCDYFIFELDTSLFIPEWQMKKRYLFRRRPSQHDLNAAKWRFSRIPARMKRAMYLVSICVIAGAGLAGMASMWAMY